MKIIFDFDDVLFDTKSFKVEVFSKLYNLGVSEEIVSELYQKHRRAFNLRKLYEEAISQALISISEEDLQKMCDEVLKDLTGYVDERLVQVIHGLGKENCFILTAGEVSFQNNKIRLSGMHNVVSGEQTVVVDEDKKESIESICELYRNEAVIFVDDKKKYIEDSVSLKIPNLFPVLYDERGFEALNEVIKFCHEHDKELNNGPRGIPFR